MKNAYYPHLFEPLVVNGMTLKNRIIASPIVTFHAATDMDMIEQVARKAKGGAALITIGSVQVDFDRSLIVPPFMGPIGFWFGSVEKLSEYVSVIHQYGAKASVELIHCGMWGAPSNPALHPIGPVNRLRDEGKDADNMQIDAMDEAMMHSVVQNYARAAVQAQKMGFDAVMLHFAHGWLPAQFLSPRFNTRTDEYGGSLENRMRFPLRILEEVRKAVGPHFPLDMRISGDERLPGGMQIDEVVTFLKAAEPYIDMVHVSSGHDKYYETSVHMVSPSLEPHQLNVQYAEKVKQALRIPVTTVGAITMPDEAEEILFAGKADLIAMCRALNADPEWPNKALNGRANDITPCLRCVQCYHVATQSRSLGCAVNPYYLRYARLQTELKKPAQKKRVVVIGGGPAGMKAAITASEFGHSVILLEKESELGGLIRYADYEQNKIDLQNYKRYITGKTLRSNLEIHLGTEATPDLVMAYQPDVVIVAVGSEPVTPPIPGIDLPHVFGALDAYPHLDELGERVVIIGGGQVGCEMALGLAESGREVFVAELSDTFVPEGNLFYRESMRQKIEVERRLTMLLNTKCIEILSDGVRVLRKDGTIETLQCDSVVCAAGMRAKKELANSFAACCEDVRFIGDCVRARRVDEATHEGFFAAATIGCNEA